MLIRCLLILLLTGLYACRVSEKTIPGTYHSAALPRFELQLQNDYSFLYTIPATPMPDAGETTQADSSFVYTGRWEYKDKKLYFHCGGKPESCVPQSARDSIGRFTSISSFSFADPQGNPVLIRQISYSPAVLKPHYGNSLYFFAQDFKQTDTLVFYFKDYPAFRYPGSIPYSIGNNLHKVTLYQPYLLGYLDDLHFSCKKNQLVHTNPPLQFTRVK